MAKKSSKNNKNMRNQFQNSKPTKSTFDIQNHRIRVVSIIVIIALLGGVLLSVFSGTVFH